MNVVMEQFLQSAVGILGATAASDSIGLILAASAIGAAIAALGGALPSLGQGMAVAKAVEAIGRQPEATGQIRSTMIIGCAIAETGGIYGLFVAILLLYVNPFVSMYLDAIQAVQGF
jgi:F-type H+-transporting ATPase subunit c